MGLAQIDWETEELQAPRPRQRRRAGAAVRPAQPRRSEGDGFVLAAVDRFVDKRTDLLILDGSTTSAARRSRRSKLPFALPMAFHGSWMAA